MTTSTARTDYVIRCHLSPECEGYADPEVQQSWRVRDASDEVMYFNDIDTAISFAMDFQDRPRTRVSYTVEAAKCAA